jgi:hypothetical protein
MKYAVHCMKQKDKTEQFYSLLSELSFAILESAL